MLKLKTFSDISVNLVKHVNKMNLFITLSRVNILGQNHCLFATRPLYSLCVKLNDTNCSLKSCDSSNIARNFLFANYLKTAISHRGLRSKKKEDPPVDYLPFPWERKQKTCLITTSGDLERNISVDPMLPKPNFELSEELKTADENVKKLFTLQTGSKREIKEVQKKIWLQKFQQHPLDFSSLEVKIALRTLQVRTLLEHRITTPYETRAKVILLLHISRRNKLLKILRQQDYQRFSWLIKELNIEYTPSKLGMPLVRYTRKNELRRLTKEYCEKVKKDKMDAYHAKLKEQQEAFLKEKEETLAWIATEEKALGITCDEKGKQTEMKQKSKPKYVAYRLYFDNYVG